MVGATLCFDGPAQAALTFWACITLQDQALRMHALKPIAQLQASAVY